MRTTSFWPAPARAPLMLAWWPGSLIARIMGTSTRLTWLTRAAITLVTLPENMLSDHHYTAWWNTPSHAHFIQSRNSYSGINNEHRDSNERQGPGSLFVKSNRMQELFRHPGLEEGRSLISCMILILTTITQNSDPLNLISLWAELQSAPTLHPASQH